MNKLKRFLIGAIAGVIMLGAVAIPTLAESLPTIDFESYSLGSISGQDGWSNAVNPTYDQEVVTNTYGFGSFGSQTFRMSNAVTSGSFGDWVFSKALVNEAGETDAQNGGISGGTRQPHFEASWDFASAVPNSEQVGLQLSVSPDRGDGARMSFIRMKDTPTGLAVEFSDYKDAAPFGSLVTPSDGCSDEDDFTIITIASNLDRTVPHNIKVTMDLIDGPRNDVVKVYVDGTLIHTDTSWEDYFRWCTESGGGVPNDPVADSSRTVDSLIFQARISGGTAPDTDGEGFLFDNISLSSGPTPVDPFAIPAECSNIADLSTPIIGTGGSDNIQGTNGNDLIFALGGSDKVTGNGGNDCIVGGAGSDKVLGNNGDDVILGGDGSDSIEGNNGEDMLFGGAGSDSLRGGGQNDELFGGVGSDSLRGDGGTDEADGGLNSDACNAETETACEG